MSADVSSMLPSSASSWKGKCKEGCQASCIACATWWSTSVKAPPDTEIVSAMKATLRTTIPARRGARASGTGGALGERFGGEVAEMLGAAEHRSERTPAGVPAPRLRGGDE